MWHEMKLCEYLCQVSPINETDPKCLQKKNTFPDLLVSSVYQVEKAKK